MVTKYVSSKIVDDYEHEGDLQRELESFYGLHIKVIRTEPGDYDNPAPTIYFQIDVSDDKISDILIRLRARIDRAKRTGDYGYCMHPSFIEYILEDIDKKSGSTYSKQYAEELKKLNDLYNE